MAYQIGDRCMACHNCAMECPVGAIHFVHTKYEVDPEKCISCGHCAQVCNTGMIFDPDQAPVIEPHEPNIIEADLVILGGGASGLVAAVRAAEAAPGKRIVVLEKAAKTGGNAWYANNFMVHNSKWQQECGVRDTCPELIEYYYDMFGDKIDHDLIRKSVRATGEFFDWLEAMDKEEVRDVFKVTPGHVFFFLNMDLEVPTFYKRRFYNLKCRDASAGPGAAGSYVIRQMRKRCVELGISIHTSCKAERLELDSQGHFSSVVASDPGGITKVNARYCIMATGGWTQNDALIRQLKPMFFEGSETNEPIHRFAVPTVTGDVIPLGESVGACIDYENMWMNVFGPVHHPFSYSFVRMGMFPENLYVNMDGKRFFNESDFFTSGAVIHNQPGRVVYDIVDSETLKLLMNRLVEAARHPKAQDFVYESWVFEDYEKDLADELETGTAIFKADSLEELAGKCGINPDTFCKTIQDYNSYCRSGEDPEFGKAPNTMRPIVKGPFYAFFNKMATDGSFGGALINADYQVLNRDRQIIPGLYATGDNAGGWGICEKEEGDHRKFILSELTWALTSGFNAGHSIGVLLKQEETR